jgi:hypothetical protein
LRKEGVTTRAGWPPQMVACGWKICCSQLGGVVFHGKRHYVKKGRWLRCCPEEWRHSVWWWGCWTCA